MPSTTRFQLPYPVLTDSADVPRDVKALADRLELVLAQLADVRGAGAIPGEIRMWSGPNLPEQATYGRWVWADGASYAIAANPLAAANIGTAWNTHGGKTSPGAGNFRVPDLRGSLPAGMDAMPGGARANRITRAGANTLAATSGSENHTLTTSQLPAHNHPASHTLAMDAHVHGVNDPGHFHNVGANGDNPTYTRGGAGYGDVAQGPRVHGAYTGISIQSAAPGVSGSVSVGNNTGGGGSHENLPPTTFVPYIVKLDD